MMDAVPRGPMLRTLVRSLSLVAILAGSAAAAGGNTPATPAAQTSKAKSTKAKSTKKKTKAKKAARKNTKHAKRQKKTAS